ncbi:hypothetical protein [Ramlibacter sp.]|uniref:hypothetical protein n=1 Tax=Ramlibacter sp. TaxID=1917967 RepID=UPI002D2D256D|nr:hypothetical protein [Ramlibacter sp.]HYD76215.1 hypothetical protein [Ramlibacter sp.]
MKKGILAASVAVLLGACGGGGGGGGSVAPSTPVAIQITQDNARPVGAHATDSVQNTGAAQGSTSLITGVQVEGGGNSGSASMLSLAGVVRSLAGRAPGPALASGIEFTEACDGGRGTITVSGSVADENRLARGDSITIRASQCSVGGDFIDGAMSISVTDGQMSSVVPYPFRIVLAVVASKLSVSSGGVTATSNGDVTLDWSATSDTEQTLLASGSSLSNGMIAGGVSRSATWRNYSQSIRLSGTEVTSTLSADVESDSPQLGAGGGSYGVTTPTALRWNTATGLPVAGVIVVSGAADSRLKLTFAPGGATLDIDADGDGSYESVVNSTAAELRDLL